MKGVASARVYHGGGVAGSARAGAGSGAGAGAGAGAAGGARVSPGGGGGSKARVQGLTLVHFSAQRKHISWDTLGA